MEQIWVLVKEGVGWVGQQSKERRCSGQREELGQDVGGSYPRQEEMVELMGLTEELLATAKIRQRHTKSERSECMALVQCSFRKE